MSFHTNSRRSGYTGRLFEGDFFGKCTTSWFGGYIPFRRAQELARKTQPKQAVNEFGRQLLIEVARQLGVVVEEVKLFTALESALDKIHSVDAWVEWNGIEVTIDVTCGKKEEYKAQVIVTEADTHDFTLAADRIVHVFRHPPVRS